MVEQVFALDIGTQSVSGILLEKQDKTYKVMDYYIKHHQERSMLDGQIQQVMEVADVIRTVKEKLEDAHGPLTKVCVAAAGRALKTITTKKAISITDQPLTTQEAIDHLELSAVQQAQLELVKQNNQQFANYHCVGFSVLHYYLDGEKIGSLIDQTGNEAAVEVITTFLPKIVIESLLAALERSDLKMEALTLEPIAAIHVLIPASMRRLNVALIDIGAGTSDIAISNDGTVIAYGMVPVAGDEITEAISDAYLLDFKEAEAAKQQIVNEGSAMVHDILGFETEITLESLLEKIDERIDHLAAKLGEEVLTLNGKVPQAVMLVGGGSLTPNLAEKLARYLQLPSNRVAIRGIDGITYLDKENQRDLPPGPEFVTPIGIAISATQNPLHYTNVYVNDRLTLMFKTKALTIGDCLIQAGADINKYYGKIGLSYIISVNGQTMTLRGEYGKGPIIKLNRKLADVNDYVMADDHIEIIKGEDGKEPAVKIKEIIGEKDAISFYFNGSEQILKTHILVNKHPVPADYQLKDKDIVEEETINNLADFLLHTYPELLQHNREHFEITVNNRNIKLPGASIVFLRNGVEMQLSDPILEGDDIIYQPAEKVTVQTVADHLNMMLTHSIQIAFNGEPITLTQTKAHFYRGDTKLSIDSEITNQDHISIKEAAIRPFIFQDVFRYVDIDLADKGTYKLYINEEAAGFHDEIIHGSQLQIIWDEKTH